MENGCSLQLHCHTNTLIEHLHMKVSEQIKISGDNFYHPIFSLMHYRKLMV